MTTSTSDVRAVDGADDDNGVALDQAVVPVNTNGYAEDYESVLINRSKGEISPFAEIIKTPNYASNSGNLTGYSVEIKDVNEETGFKHLGNVGADYLLLTNIEVRELALDIASRSGLDYRESRIYWDGARFLHVIDFLQSESIGDGEEFGIGLVTRTSYDQSWQFTSALMGKRFVCGNGMLSGEFFSRVSFRHLLKYAEEKPWQEIVQQGMSLIDSVPENMEQMLEAMRALRQIKMTDATMRDAWRLAPSIGPNIKAQIMSRYVEREEPTMFGFLNAGTNVLWHREKPTASDVQHNDAFTTGLVNYAMQSLN